jgi:hypothetical protein
MWGPVVVFGRCDRRPAASPGLRLSPLEVFAQGQFQPVLSWILLWIFALAFVRLIVHHRPSFECCAQQMIWRIPSMGENQSLAPLPQQALAGWHKFVATGNQDLLRPLLSEYIVFRSPFVQSPIAGRTATLLVLTTVVQIFENFRYHREFVAGPHDAALEFGANIGKWQLKGIDLIKFNESGEMIEFEVMIRPIKALQALGEEMGNRIGPELMRLKAAAVPH